MRRVRWIAMVPMAGVVALAVTTVVVVASTPHAEWGLVGLALVALPPSAVGLLVAWRRPGARLGWILLAGPLAVALVGCGAAVGHLAVDRDPASQIGAWALWLGSPWPVLFVWPLALVFSFPSPRLPSPRWRPVVWLALVSSAGVIALLAVAPELEGPHGRIPNPLPVTLDEAVFLPPFWACWIGLVLSLFGGAALLRARYRTGGPDERRQILWLVYGALLMPLWLGGGRCGRGSSRP